MKKLLLYAAALLVAPPALAEDKVAPSPNEIVAAAPIADWVAIPASDLLVMDLTPDAKGKLRRVVIQLMPPPFSQGWIGNVRKLAAARFWDGTAINRVQDNYVVQWGDPNADDKAKAKALPAGLAEVPQDLYRTYTDLELFEMSRKSNSNAMIPPGGYRQARERYLRTYLTRQDQYAPAAGFVLGWPIAGDAGDGVWPVHCYGMVGVGRDMPPNTGTGAELYVVIGHAPRHLDRNIALVGRVIEGIEYLSSLPRGRGGLGFYDLEQGDERVPIVSIHPGVEVKDLPAFEYLSTESGSFAKYADARANRRDPFFVRPAGGADICNIPVPVRRAKG